MSVEMKFLVIVAVIVLSTAAGYLARRLGWLSERTAEPLMTFVFVFGYSSVGFLSIWNLPLKSSDMWLPVLGGLHVAVLLVMGLGVGRMLTSDRQEVGLFGITSALGNNGFTMGGFIVYLIYGSDGLGLVNILGLMWTPTIVLLIFPVALHCSTRRPTASLGRLILNSIFNWRSIGLPMTLAAIGLSAARVPFPRAVLDWHVMDAMMFILTPLVYFSIGLRLHVDRIWPFRRLIAGLAVVRFPLAAGVGILLAALTSLTPWPLDERGWAVLVIESFVPTAVTAVAVANMFGVKPREASVLFVVNTVMYLAAVLPLVLWLFG